MTVGLIWAQSPSGVIGRAGAIPWVVDLSMKAHDVPNADVTGAQVAAAAGTSWTALDERTRQDAAAVWSKPVEAPSPLAGPFHRKMFLKLSQPQDV